MLTKEEVIVGHKMGVAVCLLDVTDKGDRT